MALVGQRNRFKAYRNASILETAGECIESFRAFDFPAHEVLAFIAFRRHDQALLAIVHAEGTNLAAGIDLLHAEKIGREALPIRRSRGTDAYISERCECHCTYPWSAAAIVWRRQSVARAVQFVP